MMSQRDPIPRASRRPLKIGLGLIVLLAACATVWVPSENYHRTAEVAGNTAIGSKECVTCHEDVLGHAPVAAFHADCESCHGDGSLHAESEAPGDTRFPSDQDCLTCHEAGRSTHLEWATSDHEEAGVICSDCHNPHNREPLHVRQVDQVGFTMADSTSQLCSSCHADVTSRFNLPSHHPVTEGMIGCTDCHSPHGDDKIALGGINQQCTSCHEDHAGPWIYEHPPAVEDCTSCHQPHGTAANHLLATSQPALCLSCHSIADERHVLAGEGLPVDGTAAITSPVAMAFYNRCSDCHGAIHGSFQDPHLRR